MSYDFPAIAPTSAPLTPGEWPSVVIRSADGGESTVTTQNKELGRELPLGFLVLNSELAQIIAHYNAHGIWDNFSFTTTTIPAFYTPAGYTWRWKEQPAVGDLHNNVRQIACSFICVPLPSVSVNTAPASITWSFSGGLLNTETTAFERVNPAAITVSAGETESMVVNFSTSSSGVVQDGKMQVTNSFTTTGIIYPATTVLTSLLLHCDGTVGSYDLVDSSTYGHTITRLGTTTELTRGVISNLSVFGQAYNRRGTPASPDSNIGAGAYLSVPGSNLFLFEGPFLISMRFRHWSHFSLATLFSIGCNGFTGQVEPGHIRLISDDTKLEARIGGVTATATITTGPLAVNTYNHVIITRWPSGMIYMSLNGVVVGTPVSYPYTVGCDISSVNPQQRLFYILAETQGSVNSLVLRTPQVIFDEFIVQKGGFTTDFSVPTSPYPNP